MKALIQILLFLLLFCCLIGISPDNLGFPMPVDVSLGDELKRVSIPAGGIKLDVPGGIIPEIDPKGWVLFKTESMAEAKEQKESSDQPHRAARIE